MPRQKLLAAILSFSAGACASDKMSMPEPGAPTPTAFKLRVENIAPWTVLKSALQAQKLSGAVGGAGPGDELDITFTAGKKQSLSFAAMWGETNDWLFATGPEGIALYDASGNPMSGDVTSQVSVWNAGTEIDQEPGVGDAVGPNQSAPDYGAADPDPTVREVPTTVTLSNGSTFTRPAVSQMIQVTLVPGKAGQFTLKIANVSTSTTLVTSQGSRAIHVSPVMWALHVAPAPLFTPGQRDRGQGLEYLAESGNGAMLATVMKELSGAATPLSPGVFVVHSAPEPLFALGQADLGLGLEHLAEDGNNMLLAAAMTGAATQRGLTAIGTFEAPVGATAARAPAKPGDAFEIALTGVPGDRVSFASMFGMSDDWFFSTEPEGIALFDESGNPASGEVSEHVGIYDVGSELDEELAIGPDTGPQQPAPDSGAADPVRQVREVAPAIYGVPASAHVRVTLTPE